jgi:hypothetical protein
MPVVRLSGVAMQATQYAKRRIATAMFVKGKAFAAAAILLEQKKRELAPTDAAFESVFLHLLCQAIETSLKGLLLFRNYDRYRPMLAKPLGHNLEKIIREALSAYGLKPLNPTMATELDQLNSFYSHHLLRYGGISDVFIDPHTIPRNKVLRRLNACFHLAEREVAKVSKGTAPRPPSAP